MNKPRAVTGAAAIIAVSCWGASELGWVTFVEKPGSIVPDAYVHNETLSRWLGSAGMLDSATSSNANPNAAATPTHLPFVSRTVAATALKSLQDKNSDGCPSNPVKLVTKDDTTGLCFDIQNSSIDTSNGEVDVIPYMPNNPGDVALTLSAKENAAICRVILPELNDAAQRLFHEKAGVPASQDVAVGLRMYEFNPSDCDSDSLNKGQKV